MGFRELEVRVQGLGFRSLGVLLACGRFMSMPLVSMPDVSASSLPFWPGWLVRACLTCQAWPLSQATCRLVLSSEVLAQLRQLHLCCMVWASHIIPSISQHVLAPLQACRADSAPGACRYGVSQGLYEQFLRPLLLVGMFAPPEELSAAAMLGTFYFYSAPLLLC